MADRGTALKLPDNSEKSKKPHIQIIEIGYFNAIMVSKYQNNKIDILKKNMEDELYSSVDTAKGTANVKPWEPKIMILR